MVLKPTIASQTVSTWIVKCLKRFSTSLSLDPNNFNAMVSNDPYSPPL